MPATLGAKRLKEGEPLSLEYGGVLPELAIEYETWGRLSKNADNAVLICPAFSANCHARSQPENIDPGWWEGMIGPGLAFDTDRFFVICASLLGGWAGTTGPNSIDPNSGQKYAGSFPIITIRDIVDVQMRLVDRLGITTLFAAAGGSMGAMETIDLAIRYPTRCRNIIALSGTDRTRPYTATIRHVGRRAIMLDPEFQNGNYQKVPAQGLKLAREIGTIFYRSRQDFNTRFSCDPIEAPTLDGLTFDFQSYLNHMGNKILDRFDANSYLRLSLSMDLHDASRGFADLADALSQTRARFFVMGVLEDPLIPIDEQEGFHRQLLEAGKQSCWHQLSSRFGHDAFLKEFDWLTPRLQRFLKDS